MAQFKMPCFEMQFLNVFFKIEVQLPLGYEALAEETLANNSKTLHAKEDD